MLVAKAAGKNVDSCMRCVSGVEGERGGEDKAQERGREEESRGKGEEAHR